MIFESHPVWVCGLKHDWIKKHGGSRYVTPCMGVWIETLAFPLYIIRYVVTPCMGVWIETSYLCTVNYKN